MDKSFSIGKSFSRPGLLLLLAEVLLFAVPAVCSSRHFGMADGARITLAYLVAYLVPRFVLRRDSGSSWVASAVLFLLACLLIYIDFSRLAAVTLFDGYSLQTPNLKGDARGYYKWALSRYDGSYEKSYVPSPGFPMMMLGLWKVFGVSVIWPQAMNLMFMLTSVVFTGKFTRRLLSHRVSVSPRRLLAVGMLMTSLLTFYLVIGTSLLKEGSLSLATTMSAFAISSLGAGDDECRHSITDIVLFVLSCLLLAIVRPAFLYFIAMGVVVMSLPCLKREWRFSLGLMVVIGISLLLGEQLTHNAFARQAEIAGGGWNMQRFYVIGESKQFYHDLLNYYFLYPVWHKVVMLPLTMSVQFFIPLPWSYYYTASSFIETFGRFTYGWYFVGGTSLFYYFILSWRKGENMGLWPWWPAMAYASLAYVMAGSVARYVAPILPLFVPIAVYVLCRVYEGRCRKSFIWWWIVLVIVIALVLLLCLEIQQGTISKMLHTQSLVNYWKGLSY